jgi:hypothetical protein
VTSFFTGFGGILSTALGGSSVRATFFYALTHVFVVIIHYCVVVCLLFSLLGTVTIALD